MTDTPLDPSMTCTYGYEDSLVEKITTISFTNLLYCTTEMKHRL